MPTHKKGHDKDKYYHLAKDQGYRSRAAFKLIQINKRFDFLSKARVCIDLCAAPGGWCQVAVKSMPQGSIVIGVDLLPIRALRGVKTFVSDITSAECRKLVSQELQGWKADVVLCDGAPNIGAAYEKDAFVQNELVLAALKTATDHLMEGGTFCTKVYRSVDYNAVVWVLQQLFEDVQAVKPNSSRSQSSEIFLVCMKYTAPKHIDPKLLDPNHVFREVADPGLKKIDVLHKKYDQHNKRHRTGYDESLGMTLSASCTVSEFIQHSDPVRLLSDMNKFVWSESCERFKEHPSTTEELKTCFQDLRVLGKIDFKKILKWRQLMRAALAEEKAENADEVKPKREKTPLTEDEMITAEISELKTKESQLERREKKKSRAQAAKERRRVAAGITDAGINTEGDMELFSISGMAGAIGSDDVANVHKMLHRAGAPEDEYELLLEKKQLPAPVVLADENVVVASGNVLDDLDEQLEDDYKRYVERKKAKADAAGSLEGEIEGTGRKAVALKKARLDPNLGDKIESFATEDLLAYSALDKDKMAREVAMKGEMAAYVDLLSGKVPKKKAQLKKRNHGGDEEESQPTDDSSDSCSDSSDNEESEEGSASPMDSDVEGDGDGAVDAAVGSIVRKREKAKTSAVTDQWFSHPIFQQAAIPKSRERERVKPEIDPASEEYVAPAASTMLAEMPKTDKEKRKEKRKKAAERQERRAAKRSRAGEAGSEYAMGFDFAEGASQDKNRKKKTATAAGADSEDEEAGDLTLTAEEIQRREELKKGLGKLSGRFNENDNSGFEVVPRNHYEAKRTTSSKPIRKAAGPNSVSPEQRLENHTSDQEDDVLSEENGDDSAKDEDDEYGVANRDVRSYDSDHEEYDQHDRLMTLALGTMMLRGSKRKALVDASYNRYSWNDPKGLPSWFEEDEMRHNKPQLPVPKALLDQIKSRFQLTGTKEIKKVAEARARKRKRALAKLKTAKQKANSMMDNNELSSRDKIKAINKVMRSTKDQGGKPSKVYVVTKKTGAGSVGTSTGSGKGGKLKFVDKRMKKDRRAMKAANKKAGKR